jgi:hypothetical protein
MGSHDITGALADPLSRRRRNDCKRIDPERRMRESTEAFDT